ncbi:hypothetical protein ACFL1X_06600 [Candidatus Hydrogenedentota bacterium]
MDTCISISVFYTVARKRGAHLPLGSKVPGATSFMPSGRSYYDQTPKRIIIEMVETDGPTGSFGIQSARLKFIPVGPTR